MLNRCRITCTTILLFGFLGPISNASSQPALALPGIVHFKNGDLDLGGELFRPSGKGPFPALLYNHGSAPGMKNSEASRTIGPLFANAGWVFFMPYRRGQGLSASAGPYIGDIVANAGREGGGEAAASTASRLLATEQLEDQVAAYAWLKSQNFVLKDRIALAGNSYGGIETILGADKLSVCAAVAASAASETWHAVPELQHRMIEAASRSPAPLFLFQAENDYDLEPSKAIAAARRQAGKDVEYKVYPRYGLSARAGHSFAYRGMDIWFPDVMTFLTGACRK